MPEVICNTSPLQYLHQIRQLDILHTLVGRVVVSAAVVRELAEGRALGLSLPDPGSFTWVTIRAPASTAALALVTDLGPGEAEVLALGLETAGSVVIVDDGLARRVAGTLGIPFTGTLGVLVDAKRAGLISAVAPLLDELQALRFRVAPDTRAAVLKIAGEAL